jgi:uncharacterized protein (DUF1697 family)
MPSFISLLRGINVSGHNMIKMTELKALYELLGFRNVATYIQSGNVVFQAEKNDDTSVETSIERAIEKKFAFPVTVIVRGSQELGRVIKANPFRGENGIDEKWLYVTFLRSRPPASTIKALAPLAAKSDDRYEFKGREVYLYCPNGYGKTLLSNTFFEKQLKIAATTRNWRTVNTLYSMSCHTSQEQSK